jgi:dolichol-phosphate mannosyltransferase
MKLNLPRLFIVIPVYNEALNVPNLLVDFRKLKNDLSEQYILSFLMIDDGSDDDTVTIARNLSSELDLEVISLSKNMGPGAAFAAAFTSLNKRLRNEDWVITMEGDNTSQYELISKMLIRSSEGFDVVLASPYMYGGGFTNTSLIRRILSGGANLLVKDLLSIHGLLTVSSFFRLYRGSAILKMQQIFGIEIIESPGFESMLEIIMKMIMLNISISEIAMKLDSSRRVGKSKMKIIKTIFGYLALLRQKNKWYLQANSLL